MATYKTYTFENDYGGITNIKITDRFKVENEIPETFRYYIKVTATRNMPDVSDYSGYSVLFSYSLLKNGSTPLNENHDECVLVPLEGGMCGIIEMNRFTRYPFNYSYTEIIREANSNDVYTAQNTVSRDEFPYFDMNLYIYDPDVAAQCPFNMDIEFSCNMPIFDNDTIGNGYYGLSGAAREAYLDEYCVNYGDAPAEIDEYTGEYYIYNTFDTATIDANGNVTYTGGSPSGRFLIFRSNATPVMYWVNKGNSLELRLIATDIVGSVYSSINRYDVQEKAADPTKWTTGSLQYSNPWYNTFGSEFIPPGNHTIGVTFEKSPEILIFDSEEKAYQYLDGQISEEEAWDWGQSGNVNIASNETGTRELTTEFGGNESENVFSHDYMMSRSELATIGGKFFDTSVWNALLDGLKIYGNNPMDSVLSCIYFPFDLSTVCPNATAVTDIYFGSYKMENVSANKIIHRSGYKEMGSTFIKPTFRNWLDYKAMHIYLYLPYIGFVDLDVNKYLNKWLKVIYMVDIHSGECEVSLLADNLMMDTYSGQIGIKQPLTYNDLSTYFQSQITALRNGVMAAVGGPIAGAGTGAQMGANAGPYGAIAGAAAGATAGEIAGRATAMWTGFKVASTKPPLFSKGGYSSEIGANMPQYCFLVFMYNDVEIPENLLSLYGKPSATSGTVGSFSGFLSVSYVQLQCPTATDEEKNEILSLLNTGIYI